MKLPPMLQTGFKVLAGYSSKNDPPPLEKISKRNIQLQALMRPIHVLQKAKVIVITLGTQRLKL